MFHLPDASKCHLCIKINISKMEIADSARYCCFTYLSTHIYFEKTFKIYPTLDHVTSGRECVLSESLARLCEHSHLRVLILFKIFSSIMPSDIQCSVIM